LLTNSSGSVVATFTYDAYGNLTGSTGTATTPLGFAGQYTDSETGLIYMRARYFEPTTGQFISRDPIEQLTRQAYSYVNNNPLNGTDPSGLSCGWTSPWDCASDVGRAAVSGAIAVGNTAAGLAAGATGDYSTTLLNAVGITPNTCSVFYQAARPAGLFVGLVVPGFRETRLITEGIYVVRAARGIYVGQSGSISARLAQHVSAGKFTQAEVDAAERVFVSGGRTSREIAEQLRIDELGGIRGLINRRNPVGPARFDLMPPGYTRP
jgi:RHS repeat-associated protein